MHLSCLQEVLELKNVPGRQLVTAQCFTNALYIESENGLGTLNIELA